MIDLPRLRHAFPERHIIYFDSIDSTQRVAAASEPGTIVLADRQFKDEIGHENESNGGLTSENHWEIVCQ